MASEAEGVDDDVVAQIRKFPIYDGWGPPAAADDWAYASLQSGTPPEDGSVRIIGGGGGVQG